jgi:hypothetical protein
MTPRAGVILIGLCMRRAVVRKVLIIGALLCAAPALAEDEAGVLRGAAPPGETTVLTFDQEDTIEGSLRTPDGELVEARKKSRHSSLIRIRKHFRRAVLHTVYTF